MCIDYVRYTKCCLMLSFVVRARVRAEHDNITLIYIFDVNKIFKRLSSRWERTLLNHRIPRERMKNLKKIWRLIVKYFLDATWVAAVSENVFAEKNMRLFGSLCVVEIMGRDLLELASRLSDAVRLIILYFIVKIREWVGFHSK